jgi:ABC-type branched-subunit amino acid transport system substrate-binding protein
MALPVEGRTAGTVVGVLYDFPQGDGGASFEAALRAGLDEAAGTPAATRELLPVAVRGLPAGSEEEVAAGFATLASSEAVCVVGPSISDNALVASRLADAAGLPCVNYSGGERTRSEWMFHYQVGSLEEEPLLLAARMAERDLHRAAVVFDESVVGRRYRECFADACRRSGHVVVAEHGTDPLADDAAALVDASCAAGPDVLVYLGLGVSSRPVALALAARAPELPVLANSALMFGYARPDWRDGYRGWEYVDTVADDNPERAALGARSPRAAAGPIGCAAYDMGRLVGDALARAGTSPTRRGVRDALEHVKGLRATSGYGGTTMGFGAWDHGALKGPFLVLREWRDGRTVQVPRPGR